MAEYKIEEKTHELNEPDMTRSYTARDYLEWTFDGLYEIIRGKVFKMSPAPGSSHQTVSTNLVILFAPIRKHGPCQLFHAPFDVFLIKPGDNWKDTKTVVEPDLCIVCDSNKINERGCIGPPDFVLEILSASSSKRDLKTKMELYEEFEIPEYWVVDPVLQSVSRNLLKDGKYQIQRPVFEGDILTPQQFPELKIDVKEVFYGLKKP